MEIPTGRKDYIGFQITYFTVFGLSRSFVNILLLGTTFSARKIGLEFKIYTQRNSSLRTVLKAAKEFSFRKSRLNVERLFSYESDTKNLTTFESSYNDNTKPKAIDMLRHLFRLAMAFLILVLRAR